LKLSKEGLPLSTLAAKAGMDVKTARKYLKSGRLPSQMKAPRDWRTREDPFAGIWPEVEALLKEAPGLQALTIFQDLQRRYPGRFMDGQLQTLQRRIRAWRGLYGPDQEVGSLRTVVREGGGAAATGRIQIQKQRQDSTLNHPVFSVFCLDNGVHLTGPCTTKRSVSGSDV
jgi:hypothetical protein